MGDTREQVLSFLEKCEELKKCKFIMATTKIKDLLKCIVNSPELYRLFDSVTQGFDYIAEKSKCLVYEENGMLRSHHVVLPNTIGPRLAFIFCLLVDFDRNTLNFNDFLRIYFPEDGSYFGSYRAFCKEIIDSLEDIIKHVFRDKIDGYEIEKPQSTKPNSKRFDLISAISLTIKSEKQFVLQNIPEEEREGGIKMLDRLLDAVKEGNEELIDALICGYNYFILYHKSVSDDIEPLINLLAEYEQLL